MGILLVGDMDRDSPKVSMVGVMVSSVAVIRWMLSFVSQNSASLRLIAVERSIGKNDDLFSTRGKMPV